MRVRVELALFFTAVTTLVACGGISTSSSSEASADGAHACSAVCESALACPGFDQSCVTDCEALVRDSAEAGCATPRDAFLACLQQSPDVCSALTRGCSVPASNYSVCMFDYCRRSTSSKACHGSF